MLIFQIPTQAIAFFSKFLHTFSSCVGTYICIHSKNSSCNCSNSETKRAFQFRCAKWVAIKHLCPRGQASNPSLPPSMWTNMFFSETPLPPALSTWFMDDPEVINISDFKMGFSEILQPTFLDVFIVKLLKS